MLNRKYQRIIFTVTLEFMVVVVKKNYLGKYVLLELRHNTDYKHNKREHLMFSCNVEFFSIKLIYV